MHSHTDRKKPPSHTIEVRSSVNHWGNLAMGLDPGLRLRLCTVTESPQRSAFFNPHFKGKLYLPFFLIFLHLFFQLHIKFVHVDVVLLVSASLYSLSSVTLPDVPTSITIPLSTVPCAASTPIVKFSDRKLCVSSDCHGFQNPHGLRVGYSRVRVRVKLVLPSLYPYPCSQWAPFIYHCRQETVETQDKAKQGNFQGVCSSVSNPVFFSSSFGDLLKSWF